ncbi:hypothetical protein K505DRAFT_329330 [Melanomma pulvis-pyrius CBS 109.77]|uniref:Ig-like domain-containing protein n=1 Tax=Melanomma pulvis-pyrius CBS 109.77 TaxID=1314802 RepID=A0A6A6WVK1_9PLEO|nr:hypothetical protein K505DRAFT_329330 [Melanomma pulvis-pyrius CBS 109.77]
MLPGPDLFCRGSSVPCCFLLSRWISLCFAPVVFQNAQSRHDTREPSAATTLAVHVVYPSALSNYHCRSQHRIDGCRAHVVLKCCILSMVQR